MEERTVKPADKKAVKVLGERQTTECKVNRSSRDTNKPVETLDTLKIKLDLKSKLEPVKSKGDDDTSEDVSPFAELDTPTIPPVTIEINIYIINQFDTLFLSFLSCMYLSCMYNVHCTYHVCDEADARVIQVLESVT